MLLQIVLQTENNIFLNFVSLVMLLIAPILGPTVKISRFSSNPTIAHILQHLFKTNYFQIKHRYDTS